ncbi:MAG TPA: sulfite exporter TauE/SafE family protein [Cellvibrionaceae bacterium]
MIEPLALTTAFLLGFFSSTHCIGMCGGIMGALTMAIAPAQRTRRVNIVFSYNLGRLASYSVMGAFAGFFGYWLLAAGAGQFLRLMAVLLLVAMAFYLAGWWRGLTYLEALGKKLWVVISPLGQRLLPVKTPWQGFLLGLLWGWLPCGLVYTALTYAMTQNGAASGALTMFAFGMGTLPAVLLTAFAAAPLTAIARSTWVRQGGAVLLLIFAAWTLYGAVGHGHGDHHAGGEGDASLPEHHHHH